MDILPAIDLRDGRCVRLIQGNYDRQIDYDDDPAAVAVRFAEQGARWLHVVDLDGAREGVQRNLPVIRKIIASTSLQVQVGGGIRDEASVDALLDAGVARVVIGTRALEDWPWFESLTHSADHAGKIVLGLDAKEGYLAVKGWREQTTRTAVETADAVAAWPLAAIVYTDISRDGMLLGPNLEAIRALVTVSAVPIIAAGGVTEINDVRQLVGVPLAGIIIGRALYEGTLSLPEALKLAT